MWRGIVRSRTGNGFGRRALAEFDGAAEGGIVVKTEVGLSEPVDVDASRVETVVWHGVGGRGGGGGEGGAKESGCLSRVSE